MASLRDFQKVQDTTSPYDGMNYADLVGAGKWDLQDPQLLAYLDSLSNTGSQRMQSSGALGDWRTNPGAATTLISKLGLATAPSIQNLITKFGGTPVDVGQALGLSPEYLSSVENSRQAQVNAYDDSFFGGLADTGVDFVKDWGKNFALPAAAAYFGVNALGGLGGVGASAGGTAGGGMDWLTQLLTETGELGVDPLMLEGGFNAAGGGGILGGVGMSGLPSSVLGQLGSKGIGALLGGAAGLMGGAKQAGTTTTVEDIPAWLKPYALQGMEGLSEAYGQTPDGMSPITAAGGQYMQDVIGGDYLNNNPYLDAMFNQAAGKVSAGVNSQFSGAGRYGSGAHQGVLGDSLGNLATNIYGQNYQQERARQQAAAQGAPDFGTASILQPFAKSQALLQGVGGIKGGTTTSPYFRNRPAEILAGAMGGASLFS